MLEHDEPVAAKSVEKAVQYFKSDVWNNVRDQYMSMEITVRVQQLSRQTLKDTGTYTLVEASPYDK